MMIGVELYVPHPQYRHFGASMDMDVNFQRNANNWILIMV